MMYLIYLMIAIVGYFCGCSNLAYFLAKARGFDIRTYGSSNAGASNATITMGLKAGVAVAVHDAAKAFLPALLAALLFPALPLAGAVAGVAAVLGHIFPFYMGFRGGKGFASFMGMILALDWQFFLIILLAALLITLITDYIVLGTLTTIVTFPTYLFFFRQMGLIFVGVICVASLVILCKHFVNLRKLATGQEIGLRRALSKKDRV